MPTKKDAKEAKEKVAVKDSPAREDRLDKLKSVLEQRRRSRQQDDNEDKPTAPPPVSLGPAGAIVDALLNTSPEHILELTDFDRNQVTLVPQVIVIDDMWKYLEQLLSYRADKQVLDCRTNTSLLEKALNRKHPEIPDTSGKFVQVLAQTRRSLGGKMKKALEDMALAELETKSMDDGMGGVGGHDFED